MKLSSLIAATLSLTSVLSLGNLAIAETAPRDRNNNSSQYTVGSENEKYLRKNSDRRNSQIRVKNNIYNVFSVAKDVEITLNNVEQSVNVEDKEWYIEKYPQQ